MVNPSQTMVAPTIVEQTLSFPLQSL